MDLRARCCEWVRYRADHHPHLFVVPGQSQSQKEQDDSSEYAVLIFLIWLAAPVRPSFWCHRDEFRLRRVGSGW
jgi:hypothetical protein